MGDDHIYDFDYVKAYMSRKVTEYQPLSSVASADWWKTLFEKPRIRVEK